jgi:hypothetical protein
MKTSKFHSGGACEEFSLKNPPLNNFLTVQPIFAVNILMDSGQKGEKSRFIKKFQISR